MHRRPSTLVEAIYVREIWPWALIGGTVGLVEGATIAVLIKRTYATQVTPFWVDIAVAIVSGAPALANITSFIWTNLAHGRARVQLLVRLLFSFALLVGLVAFIPHTRWGLALTIAAIVTARALWAGILTLRAVVWSANYPRHLIGRMTGRIVMAGSVGVAVVALLAGWIIDSGLLNPRLLYALAAACGLLAALLYRQVRVRREFQLLAAEANSGRRGGALSIAALRRVLRENREFRRYMLWMGVYGSGNLMVNALLVVLLTDRLHLGGLTQILLLTVLPLLLMPIAVPWWARLFDQGHVIEYRALQCWALVVAIGVLGLAVATRQSWLLWPGSVLSGIGYAGATLGWSLGHNDFARLGEAQLYMGVHVTLTGVRGLIAPPAGMLFYHGLEHWRPGSGVYAVLLPLVLAIAGGLGFVTMSATRKSEQEGES